MRLYLVNADNIYFPQIKEYFREIISSYDNGNYRSSMVMLYSTIVCDLILKLKELCDVYSDSKAEKILEEIEAERKRAGNSSWEHKLIHEIRTRTELLSDEAYAMINHIYDLRNFSAHPALNEDYELISPSPEMTVAYIKKALDDIFVKPSVFAQNITDRISDDVASKKEMYSGDQEGLCKYLNKVYFERMSDKVMCQVFRAFWKFTFIKTDEDPFEKNRSINNRTIRAMLESRFEAICKFISENKTYFSVAQDDSCLHLLCVTLAYYPRIYDLLDDTVKHQVQTFDKAGERIIKWFVSGDLEAHIRELIEDEDLSLKKAPTAMLKNICEKYGKINLFSSLIITYYSKSGAYAVARQRYESYVATYMDLFNADDFVNLIEAIDENDQIYRCWGQQGRNDAILEKARPILGDTYDFRKYKNFVFTDETPEQELASAETSDEFAGFDDLPF